MRHPRPAALVFVMAVSILSWHCGGDSIPTSLPHATDLLPSPQPTATPVSGGMCEPAPPALYGISVTVLAYPGNPKLLGAEPLIWNVDKYCERVGFGSWKFCPTRRDGDPQKAACDGMATGRAQDTGRWGPTWAWDGQPCDSAHSACQHSPNDTFRVSIRDTGVFSACAAPDVTVAPGGSRCGEITIHRAPPRGPIWVSLDTGTKLLSWETVKDATSYAVYVKTVAGDLRTGLCPSKSDEVFAPVTSPFPLAPFNKCHTSYYFTVTARNDAGESALQACTGFQFAPGCVP